MDRKIFLDNLSRLLERIGIHPDVIVEIVAELKHSGNEAGFVSVLEARLKFLNEHGIQATIHKEFEPIEKGVYSMHIAGKGFNMRVLYAFSDGAPVLLLAFHEISGHKTTDYTGKVSVSLGRLKEFKEGI